MNYEITFDLCKHKAGVGYIDFYCERQFEPIDEENAEYQEYFRNCDCDNCPVKEKVIFTTETTEV